jgi:superoxide dismutase, Fe-Mn family
MNLQPAWALALEANFGGFENWRSDFVARAVALRHDGGRVRLVFVPQAGTMENRSVVDGQGGADGSLPLLEFATGEVEAFIAAIDWDAVYGRYQHAVHGASEAFGAGADAVAAGALLLDVRRAGAFDAATAMAAGATWRDPATVARWRSELPAGREVVVYCVYGHEVGRATALRLRAAGVNARFLRGGFEAWSGDGHPVQAKAKRP